MAGILIYTAAPDSEGTLGGLVSLGKPEKLVVSSRSGDGATSPVCLRSALRRAPPAAQGITLHGAGLPRLPLRA